MGKVSVPDGPLRLTDARRIALVNNPAIKVRSSGVDIAEGRFEQAGLYPNPVIGYHATQVGFQDTAGAQGAFIRQRVITGGKQRLDQLVADQGVTQAESRLEVARQQVTTDTTIGYFDLLIARRRLELAVDLVKITRELVEATKKLLDGKVATENDLLQAEIEAEQAQIVRDNASHAVRAMERRLGTILGVTFPRDHPLADELSKPKTLDWRNALNRLLSSHPLLNVAQAGVEQARASIERAHQQPVPDIDVLLSARHNNITGDDVANVQVGLPIPVFDGNQGNIRAAHADLIRAESEVQRIRLSLRRQLANVFNAYENARRQVERFDKTILPRAKSSLKIVRNAYENGQANYLLLITAQRTYVRTNLDYLASLRRFRIAQAIIEGQLLVSPELGLR